MYGSTFGHVGLIRSDVGFGALQEAPCPVFLLLYYYSLYALYGNYSITYNIKLSMYAPIFEEKFENLLNTFLLSSWRSLVKFKVE